MSTPSEPISASIDSRRRRAPYSSRAASRVKYSAASTQTRTRDTRSVVGGEHEAEELFGEPPRSQK